MSFFGFQQQTNNTFSPFSGGTGSNTTTGFGTNAGIGTTFGSSGFGGFQQQNVQQNPTFGTQSAGAFSSKPFTGFGQSQTTTFGQSPFQQFGQQTQSLFGTQPFTGFGQTSNNTFGQPQPSLFNQQPAPQGFGQFSQGFQTQQVQPQTNQSPQPFVQQQQGVLEPWMQEAYNAPNFQEGKIPEVPPP